jgi:hypothetical protein
MYSGRDWLFRLAIAWAFWYKSVPLLAGLPVWVERYQFLKY